MNLVRSSSWLHKWLALLMAVQILFWMVSGLFFAIVPIERVRSEHLADKPALSPISMSEAARGMDALARAGDVPANRIELRAGFDGPVAVVTNGDARPRLYDLGSGKQLSPISGATARRIAVDSYAGAGRPTEISYVTRASPEYRGALPAWRVNFDRDGLAVYVAADTATVAARRSTLWRAYDFLWALHIMDYKDHEDFNSWLLIGAAALGLVISVSGIIMLPSRLKFRRRRAPRRSPS